MAWPSFKRHSKNASLNPLTKRTASYHFPNYGTNTLPTIKPSWQLLQLDDLGRLLYCLLGLLRVSEFTSSSPYHSNSFTNLLLSDIATDSHIASQVIRITLKCSKTNQYRQGTHMYLSRTGHKVCLVKALIRYLDRHKGRSGLLFILPTSYSPDQRSVQHSMQ